VAKKIATSVDLAGDGVKKVDASVEISLSLAIGSGSCVSDS
jgi:hypothetical protein